MQTAHAVQLAVAVNRAVVALGAVLGGALLLFAIAVAFSARLRRARFLPRPCRCRW